MDTNNILNSISILSEKIFKSVEGNIYKLLDKIVMIGPDILKSEPLNKIFFPEGANVIILIANSLAVFYASYYILTRIISMFNGKIVENVYYFVLKITVILLLVNNSYFLCEEMLNLNHVINESINAFSKELTNKEAVFENLKEQVISLEKYVKEDNLSLEGIMKSLLSFLSISLLITFSVRYVTIILLIILSPFAIVCLTSNITKGFSKTWGKLFLINLLLEFFVKVILIIPLVYSNKESDMYKIVLFGSMYLLYRLNSVVRDFTAQISVPNGGD